VTRDTFASHMGADRVATAPLRGGADAACVALIGGHRRHLPPGGGGCGTPMPGGPRPPSLPAARGGDVLPHPLRGPQGLYLESLEIQSAIPPPRILGIIRARAPAAAADVFGETDMPSVPWLGDHVTGAAADPQTLVTWGGG